MGAYYKPVCIDTNSSIRSFDFGSGLKLMEHSWIGNTFCNAVLYEIEHGSWKNKRISWVCDYDDANYDYYSNSSEITFKQEEIEEIENYSTNGVFVLNLDKKEFFSYDVVAKIWSAEPEWVVNPLPLLTSSTTCDMGGGDYRYSHNLRGSWSFGRLLVLRDIKLIPVTFTDISTQVLFYEDDELLNSIACNKFVEKYFESKFGTNSRTRKSVFKSLLKDNEVTRVFTLDYEDDNSDIYNLLRQYDECEITFKKKDGTITKRRATLYNDYESDNNSKTNSGDNYIWFLDIDDDYRLKRCVKDDFFSISAVC